MRKRKEEYELVHGYVDLSNGTRRSSRKNFDQKERVYNSKLRTERRRILGELGRKDINLS